VRVRDVEKSIYDDLRAMEWFRYMRAMWMIGAEIQGLYEEGAAEQEQSLIAETLEVIRSVSVSEDISLESFQKASDLDDRWERMIDEGSALPGRWNAWMVFGMLMSEIAGHGNPHLGAERVYLALTMCFKEGRRTGGRKEGRISGPAEEIDEESSMAHVLTHVSRIVVGVPGIPESVRDPMVIREQLAL
jgi:hypothetical protein